MRINIQNADRYRKVIIHLKTIGIVYHTCQIKGEIHHTG